jgi:hypothetical protein
MDCIEWRTIMMLRKFRTALAATFLAALAVVSVVDGASASFRYEDHSSYSPFWDLGPWRDDPALTLLALAAASLADTASASPLTLISTTTHPQPMKENRHAAQTSHRADRDPRGARSRVGRQ